MLTLGVISEEPGKEPEAQLEGIWKEYPPVTQRPRIWRHEDSSSLCGQGHITRPHTAQLG